MNEKAYLLGKAFSIGYQCGCALTNPNFAKDAKLNGEEGRWVTSKGARIFIRNDGTPISSNVKQEKEIKAGNCSFIDNREPSPLDWDDGLNDSADDYTEEQLMELARKGAFNFPSITFHTRFGDVKPSEQEKLIYAFAEERMTDEMYNDSVFGKLREWHSDHEDEITDEESKFLFSMLLRMGAERKKEEKRAEEYKKFYSDEEDEEDEEDDYDYSDVTDEDVFSADMDTRYWMRLSQFTKKFFPYDDEEGERYYGAFWTWFTASDLVRGEGADKESISLIEEIMDKSPKHKGELWRGLSLSQKDIDKLRSEPWTDQSLSSWTMGEEIAKQFASLIAPKSKGLKKLKKVVLHIDGIDGAVDISGYSPNDEGEVLAPRGTTYEYVSEKQKGGVLYIDVKKVQK